MRTKFPKHPSIRLAAVFAVLAVSASARAATFNVTDTAGLAGALTTAQNNNEDDVINVASGAYDASAATFSYLADNTGGSEEKFSLTIVGEDRDSTILDGGNSRRVMKIETSNLSGGDDGLEMTVRNITFRNGKTTGVNSVGGGLLVDTGSTGLTVDNCRFQDNFAEDGGAGADLLAALGDVTLTNSVFTGNETDGFSGGVELFGNINVTAINNVFFDNHAGDIAGAALIQFNFGDGAGERIAIINNTVISNTAATDGGGIFVGIVEGNPERADIFNNIVFGNTATGQGDDFFFDDSTGTTGSIILFSNNDFGDFVSDCDVDAGCAPSITEQDNLSLDPALVDAVNGNFHLASNSPLIDQGSADAPLIPATDFEGEKRIQGESPDIGADEAVVCGDGIVAGDEDCDDGNTVDGDCCDGDCRFEAADSACNDGDAGTENDQCDGAGVCEGTAVGNGGGCSLVR